MSDDRQAILDVMQAWRDATRRKDLATILGLMTDDAIFLTPGNEPMTKARFAEVFRGFDDGTLIEARQDVKEVHVVGDLAYAWTHITVTMGPDDGSRSERAGHVLTIFRRGADGGWRLARDANLLVPRGS